jgi:serine/threonine protein phosphatase PrpC
MGLAEEASYAECAFRLEGDRLTLLSDGVVEARGAGGELCGFERTRAISAEPADAIAEAALRYGQADDITVLTLTLTRLRSEMAVEAHAAAVVRGWRIGGPGWRNWQTQRT